MPEASPRLGDLKRMRLVLSVMGGRTVAAFGIVTLVVVALLAAVNVASRAALARYVDEQLDRLSWDFAVYEGEAHRADEVRSGLAGIPGVARTEELWFLRTILPAGQTPRVDGKPLAASVVALLYATKSDLLPPEIRPGSADEAVLALVGPESRMGPAFLALQGARAFDLRGHEDHGSFSVRLARTVRLERSELNRWFTDRTNTPSFIPDVGVIVVAAGDPRIADAFDEVSEGIVLDVEHEEARGDIGHVESGSYFPEIIHLVRLDRARLLSGWDLNESAGVLDAIHAQLAVAAERAGVRASVGDLAPILIQRVRELARLLDLLALLIGLPLATMAWLLLASLARLLVQVDRRTYGLMRLRGVPARLLGATTMLAILAGGVLGSLAGAALGTFASELLYAGRLLPLSVLLDVQPPASLAGFCAVGIAGALAVGRGLVRYATTVSPLEASARVARSELEHDAAQFGPLEAIALAVGSAQVVAWLLDIPLLAPSGVAGGRALGPALDVVALVLFVYGAIALFVSRRSWVERTLATTPSLIAGRLKPFWLRHLSTRPHRVGRGMLVMGLMAALALYPTVMAASFADRAQRGAMAGIGGELELTLSTPDLLDPALLTGALAGQERLVADALAPIRERVAAESDVRSVTFLTEFLLSRVYVPGGGIRSIPLYVIDETERYLASAYTEDALGSGRPFADVVRGLGGGRVAVSPAFASFQGLREGSRVSLGSDTAGRTVAATVAGVLRELPGRPLQTVTDRESYAKVQVDYLNFLFDSTAFAVAAAGDPAIAPLATSAPRVAVLVRLRPDADVAAARDRILRALPVRPLDTREIGRELSKVGSDMFVELGLEQMRLYLVAGLALALVSMLAVALVDLAQERRIAALLRVRGIGVATLRQFFGMGLLAPAAIGLVLGAAASAAAGYGIANALWALREIHGIALALPTRPQASGATVVVIILLSVAPAALTYAFARWATRRTARETLGSAT